MADEINWIWEIATEEIKSAVLAAVHEISPPPSISVESSKEIRPIETHSRNHPVPVPRVRSFTLEFDPNIDGTETRRGSSVSKPKPKLDDKKGNSHAQRAINLRKAISVQKLLEVIHE